MSEQKSTIDKLLAPLGLTTIKLESQEVKLEQMKLDDNVTVIEAEVFEAGQPVVIVTEDEQKIPLPVGEYGMEDGRILVVQEEGIIFEIKEAASEEEQPAEEEAPVAASEKAPAPVAKKIVEAVSKETYFSKEEIIDLVTKTIETKLSEIVKQEEKEEVVEQEEVELSTVKPITQNPERVSLNSQSGRLSLQETINNLKK